jgi:hypothetical protein
MLIEVKVLDFTILLPITEKSTVGSVTLAALDEYATFNLKSGPQKVRKNNYLLSFSNSFSFNICKILYTRDLKNRVLSSILLIIEHDIDRNLEVVVENYSDNDLINPTETERLYRGWQSWTLNQVSQNK